MYGMSVNGCEGVVSPEVESNRETLDNLIKHYNSKPRTRGIYGEIKTLEDNTPATRALDDFAKDVDPKLAIDDTFILSPGQMRRIQIRIDQHERQMSNPLGYLESLYKLPHAIMRKTPVGKQFIHGIDQAKNYERNAVVNHSNKLKEISRYFRQAHLDHGIKVGWWGKNVIKDLIKYERKLGKNSQDPTKMQFYADKVNDIVTNGDGSQIRDFAFLMNKNNVEFQDAIKMGVRDKSQPERIGQAYNGNLVRSVETARKMLHDLGEVNVAGLLQLRDAVWVKYTGTSYNDNKGAVSFNRYLRNFSKNVDEAVNRMKLGMKEGGYYPKVALSDIMELKTRGDKILAEDSQVTVDKLVDNLTVDMESMIQLNLPSNIKARNTIVDRTWSENPLFILSEYGQQAIQFNKLNTITNLYLKTQKTITKPNLDAKYMEGLGNFINDEYTIASKGLANRPAALNKLVRTAKVVETLKAMSLGVPGAIRNVAGAQFFMVNMGLKAIRTSNRLYRSGVYESDSIKRIVDSIADKQGFQFGDLGAELVTDGFLAREQADKLDFRFNVENGQVEAKRKETPNWDKLENLQEIAVKSGLVLHTMGENYIRGNMFRMALVDALESYRSQPEYWAKHNGHKLSSANWQGNHLAKKGSQLALFMVNQMAGEYSLHAKSRLLTGHPGKVSVDGTLLNKMEVGVTAATSLATGLLHYPMFISDMQYKKVEGAIHSIGARQWNSPENQYLARYASFYAFIQAMSIVFNMDLNRVFENDTIDRFFEISREIAGPEPEDLKPDGTLKDNARGYYGVLGQVTGPIVDDLSFGMMSTGLLSMPDSWFQRTIFGYDRLLESDDGDAKERAYWNRMGTAFGFFGNKVIPAARDGRGLDIAGHMFGLWPSSHTRKGRELVNKFSPYKPFKESKKKGKTISYKESMRRQKYRRNTEMTPIQSLEKELRRIADY